MRSTSHAAALALLSLVALAGCSKSSGHSGHSTAPVSWSFVEVEPNDTALTANIAGSLYVGDRYTIFGSTTDLGFDPFDGFAFFPEQALELEFTLTVNDPNAILQVCMVAPFGGPPPLCWNTTQSSGVGFATLPPGGELHLVISSLWGATNYRLEVTGYPPSYSPASTEASGAQAGTQPEQSLAPYLGALVSSRLADPMLEVPVPEDSVRVGTLLHVDEQGEVHLYPIGVDRVGPFVELGPHTRSAHSAQL